MHPVLADSRLLLPLPVQGFSSWTGDALR